jgi:NAD(P)H-hydrate repair Nnr-like enzyme with NAD(P)H-hydrate dehydratase domain
VPSILRALEPDPTHDLRVTVIALAATDAFIHDRAARLASKSGPISASSIIEYVPEAIRKILG